MDLIRRHLAARVERAIRSSRIVNVVGPRQAGKTTLVRDLVEASTFVTLDDDAQRDALAADPMGQLTLLADRARASRRPVVIDEIQRLPALTLALKRLVDADRRPGQFLLTGSSDIFASGKAYDSLAGRLMTLRLHPLSAAEIAGAGPCRLLDLAAEAAEGGASDWPIPSAFDRSDVVDLIVRGGYPEIRVLADRDRADRYHAYLDAIVERDVAPISEVRKPDLLRRLLDQAAARTGQEIQVADLCRGLGARKETVNHYLDVLERLGIVGRLGAWAPSAAGRDVRAPKLHHLDTGCATALRGEDADSFGFGADPAALGHLLESFVFSEIEKSLPFQSRRWRLWHWRRDRREVDLVAEAPGGRLLLIEAKAAATVGRSDFRHLDWFLDEGPGRGGPAFGCVLHLGQDILSFGPNRLALPISMLWSFADGG